MDKSSRIYVAGHTGLVGSAIVAELCSQGYGNLILRSHSELDLTNQAAVTKFFADAQPEYVFLAAARVGGILANSSRPADFISDNLLIAVNAVTESRRASVKRLVFLGSSCIYPRMARQPLTEDAWLTGPLEPTNRPYAIAKIAGVEMCWSFNRQFGTHYIAVMPTNLYGPGDNYDPDGSHLIPALIRKLHGAKVRGIREVVIWGTGTPKREFLYSEDAADACVFLANLPDAAFEGIVSSEPPILNVGSGSELTIVEVAEMVRETVDVNVTFKFDHTKPDGTPRKLLDSSRINALGWRAATPLREGLRLSYQSFLSSGLGSVQQSSLVKREPLTV
jgi:GDP-L-fucose synthase